MPKEGKEKKEKKEKKSEDAPAEEASAEEKQPPAEEKKKIGNVFALFSKGQIQEFKEAFTMIDNDRDGFIGEADLAAIFSSTGREADSKTLKEMLKECPDKINFTHFLTLFGEKLHGTDSETMLRDAFKMFDEENTGKLHEEYVKDLLQNVGDQYSKDKVKQVWKEAPIDGGQLDYLKFVLLIKRGNQEE